MISQFVSKIRVNMGPGLPVDKMLLSCSAANCPRVTALASPRNSANGVSMMSTQLLSCP